MLLKESAPVQEGLSLGEREPLNAPRVEKSHMGRTQNFTSGRIGIGLCVAVLLVDNINKSRQQPSSDLNICHRSM